MPVVQSRGVPLDMDRIGEMFTKNVDFMLNHTEVGEINVFLIVFFFLYESWFVLYLILYILYATSWEGPRFRK